MIALPYVFTDDEIVNGFDDLHGRTSSFFGVPPLAG
jgi:hypothetical protein